MIHAGDAITNPVTGERLVFHRTASDTDGQYVLLEATVQPNGFVAAGHVHPNQTERFEVLDRGKQVASDVASSAAETAKESGREHAQGAAEDAKQAAQETREQVGSS